MQLRIAPEPEVVVGGEVQVAAIAHPHTVPSQRFRSPRASPQPTIRKSACHPLDALPAAEIGDPSIGDISCRLPKKKVSISPLPQGGEECPGGSEELWQISSGYRQYAVAERPPPC